LDRASVIILVIAYKVQLSVEFSYLLICAFSSENIFKLFCYIILDMSRQNRVKKLINLNTKKDIISKRESRKSVDLSAEYGMAKPTISISLKNKEKISVHKYTDIFLFCVTFFRDTEGGTQAKGV
jgi:hypothetical protein